MIELQESSYVIMEAAGQADYRASIARAVRGLWSGLHFMPEFIAEFEFIENMQIAIGNGLTRAFNAGAAEVGIMPNDFTQAEINARDEAILIEFQRITSLANFVIQNSKSNGGTLRSLQYRVNMWANQYNALRNKAKIMAGADKKLEWFLGATEEHCRDCSKYAGRVYRASTWDRYEIQPQSRRLACKGFNCDCKVEPSDKPCNKGRPPGMSG